MSSREIADLTKSRHFDVIRSIVNLTAAGILTAECPLRDFESRGKTYQEYLLTKRDSLVVVARFSPEFTAAIVDRWQELETKELQSALPTNYIESLEALLFSEREKLAAQQQLQEQRPMIAIYDALCNRKDAVSTTALAKKLGLRSAQQLNKFFREKRIKFLNSDRPQAPYSEWFSVVDVKIGDGDKFAEQCLITPLGQIEITKRWNKANKELAV